MGGVLSAPISFTKRKFYDGYQKALSGKQQEEPDSDDVDRKRELEEKIIDFQNDLDNKRERRKLALARISAELNELRISKEELDREKSLRERLEKQINALKEVSSVSEEMLKIRESQLADVKTRLKEMETSTEQSLRELRSKYEQQMNNINKLRQLYDERADAVARGHQSEMEREKARYRLLELKMADAINIDESAELKCKITQLEESVRSKDEQLTKQKEVHNSDIAQCKNLTAQLTLINNLFSNMLTGNELDFDLLTRLLQDNHNLIIDLIANGDINETAAVLFGIAEKVYKQAEELNVDNTPEQVSTSAKEEIASNLPKVWRVLIELMSRHVDCNVTTRATIASGALDECYKNVQTPHGSRTVISVSQTFLRLKDLILEKNSLVKEVTRLKTLNGHLENRLDLQEKRLSTVCSELKKTWGVVSKLKVQHKQLHTNEKVLRYELRHKRQMLNNLKDELQYCRDTWDLAREKNTQTEHDWELLRKEFASRKNRRDVNNSAESGYEDDQSPDISISDSDNDLSEGGIHRRQKLDDQHAYSGLELEEAASDSTVIELTALDSDNEIVENIIAETECTHSEAVDLHDQRSNVTQSEDQDHHTNESSIDDTVDNLPEISSYSHVTMPSSSSPIVVNDSAKYTATTTADDGMKQSTIAQTSKSSEDILKARSERLKRLENQCRSLLNQMSLTSLRSDTLSLRLEELHEQYSSSNRSSSSSSSSSNSNNDVINGRLRSSSSGEILPEQRDRLSMDEQEQTSSTELLENTNESSSLTAEKDTAETAISLTTQSSEINERIIGDEEETSQTRDRRLDRVHRIEEEYLQIFHQPAISPEALEQIRNSNNRTDDHTTTTSTRTSPSPESTD